MELQAARHDERMTYTEKPTIEQIKKLTTERIKHYLHGKTIKNRTIDYQMVMELKSRGEDITKYNLVKK